MDQKKPRTHLRKPPPKRQPPIPRKRPNLPRTRRNITHAPKRRHNNHYTRHSARPCFTPRHIIKHLDERLPRWRGEYIIHIPDHHAECDKHDEAQTAVYDGGGDHGARKGFRRVDQFFGHVGCGVGADEGEDRGEHAD